MADTLPRMAPIDITTEQALAMAGLSANPAPPGWRDRPGCEIEDCVNHVLRVGYGYDEVAWLTPDGRVLEQAP